MKNKIFWALLAIVFISSSCDKNEWPVSDIKLVPVYKISTIVAIAGNPTGTVNPYALEIYKEKALLVEYSTTLLTKPLITSEYVDATDDVNYKVTFNASEASKTKLGADTVLNRSYELTADKLTKVGTMKITKFNVQEAVISNYTFKIVEDKVYN